METLAHLFDWLLTASARASLLSVVVLGLQVLLRHRVAARWRYALWLPVLAVLLTPAFPESQWSVGSFVRTGSSPLPVPEMVAHDPALNVTPSAVGTAETPAPTSWSQIMRLAWLLGAAGMIVICLGSYALTLWRIKNKRVPVSDALLHEIAALAKGIGLRRAPRVWMSPVVRSPAVTGVWRPVLLLPVRFDESLTAQEARLVLRHELTHLKRGDLLLNALLCLLVALHWFNPLLWLAFFRVRLDREAACDAQVLDREPQAERVAYGHTLLKVESTFSPRGLSLGFVGIFQRGSALRSRIQSIAKQPTQSITMKTTLSLGIALLTFLGITKAAPPDKNAPQILIEKPADKKSPLQAKLDAMVIPQMQFRNATLTEAVEFLRRKSIDLDTTTTDPNQKGVNIIVKADDKAAEAKITLDLKNVPLGAALKYVAQLSGLQLVVEPHAVLLLSQADFEARQKQVESSAPGKPGMVITAESISIDKGTGVVAASGDVKIKTSEGTISTEQAKVETKPSAGKIILPKVQFRDATLTEAVEFIRVKSRELDPEKKGVNILVKPGSDPKAKITMDLRDVPAYEALRYCAELSGCKLTVDGDAFVITPVQGAR